MPLDKRSASKHHLIHIALGNMLCSVSGNFLRRSLQSVQTTLDRRIGQFYQVYDFHASARLDLPTFQDTAVQQQLLKARPVGSSYCTVWRSITNISNAGFKNLTLVSQIIVLIRVIGEQRDGLLLAILCIIYSAISLFVERQPTACSRSKVILLVLNCVFIMFAFSMGCDHQR